MAEEAAYISTESIYLRCISYNTNCHSSSRTWRVEEEGGQGFGRQGWTTREVHSSIHQWREVWRVCLIREDRMSYICVYEFAAGPLDILYWCQYLATSHPLRVAYKS